jgi:AraC family transcriptional regulator
MDIRMRVEYRQLPTLAVFYARGTGPYGAAAREAWQRMSDWLDQFNARRRVKQGIGFFRDNPRCTPPELLRYDACVPVTGCADLEPGPGIGRQTLPGGAHAVHTHVGSYDGIGGLFSQLHNEILPKRALSVDYERPFRAVFLNDPRLTREMHRRVELCVPVLPLAMPAAGNDDGEHIDDSAEIVRRIMQVAS